jgi:tetratricopeptide (TPR) repeat protein
VTTQFGWRAVESRVLAERGVIEEAERLAREAVDLAETTEYMRNRADGLFDLGVVLAAAGKNTEAAEAFADSLRLWERKGDLVMAAETRERLAELQSSGSPSQ